MAKKSVAPKPTISRRTPAELRALDDFVDGRRATAPKPKETAKKKSKKSKTQESKKSAGAKGSPRTRGAIGRPPLEEERIQMTIYLPKDLRDKLRKRSLEESLAQGRKVPETDIVIEALRAHL